METLDFKPEIKSTFSATINGYEVEDENVYDTVINKLTKKSLENTRKGFRENGYFIRSRISGFKSIKFCTT